MVCGDSCRLCRRQGWPGRAVRCWAVVIACASGLTVPDMALVLEAGLPGRAEPAAWTPRGVAPRLASSIQRRVCPRRGHRPARMPAAPGRWLTGALRTAPAAEGCSQPGSAPVVSVRSRTAIAINPTVCMGRQASHTALAGSRGSPLREAGATAIRTSLVPMLSMLAPPRCALTSVQGNQARLRRRRGRHPTSAVALTA